MSDPCDFALDFADRYTAAATLLFARLDTACDREADWMRGVRAAIVAGLSLLAEDPALARLLLLDPDRAGHEMTLIRLAMRLRSGRALLRCGPLPVTVEEDLIAAVALMASRPLRRGEPERLPLLVGELTTLLLTPYIGRESAERIAAGAG